MSDWMLTEDEIGPEPEGFWDPIHAQVDAWTAKYAREEDDDVESD